VYIPDPDDQEALLNQRNLLSPGGAARVLGISRQAVQESAPRPGGRLLEWAFAHERARRIGELYIDFGLRRPPYRNPRPEDAHEWHGSDPADLLADARKDHRLELAGAEQGRLL
jgi:hypothetical protein